MRKKNDTSQSVKTKAEEFDKEKVNSFILIANALSEELPPQGKSGRIMGRGFLLALQTEGEKYFNEVCDRITELIDFFSKNPVIYLRIMRNGQAAVWIDAYSQYLQEHSQLEKEAENKIPDISNNEAAFNLLKIDISNQLNQLRKNFIAKHGQLLMDFLSYLEVEVKTLEVIRNTLTHLEFVGRNFDGRRKLKLNGLFSLFPDFYIDEMGRLAREDTEFAKAFVGIDLTKLRICSRVDCRKFFYATRKDKRCCSKKCALVFNKKVSREHKKEKHLQYQEAAKNRKRIGKVK